MAIQSPDAQLRKLRSKLQGISSESFRQQIFKSLAEEARRLIVLGFQKSAAPDGTPWAPLAAKTGSRRFGGKPLLDHGLLRNSIRVRPTSTGIVAATTNVVYAATHQYGRDGIPARPFLPTGTLPAPWAKPFRDAINSAMRRRMNG